MMMNKKTESAKEPKVVGKINLDALNESTRPKKRSKEEKAALRQQKKEEPLQYNIDVATREMKARFAWICERTEAVEAKAAELKTRLAESQKALEPTKKERLDAAAQLEHLESRAATREKYKAHPETPNDVRQKELSFMGIRPHKMDVVHFEVPKTGDREKMEGAALVRDENHYYLAVDMYDHPEREDNITTMMDDNPDGTFDGIWPKGVVLKPAAKLEERYVRNLADQYGDDLDKAETFIANVAYVEQRDMAELKDKIAQVDEDLSVHDAARRELAETEGELMQLRIERYKMEQAIKKVVEGAEKKPDPKPEVHTEEDYEPMEGLDLDSDIEQRCPHLPFLRGKRQMLDMSWPTIDTVCKPMLRFRLMGNVARLMQMLQQQHALTYILSDEYNEELKHRGSTAYKTLLPQDLVPSGEVASGVIVFPHQGYEDTVLFSINNRKQMTIIVVYIREGHLMFYESFSDQAILGQPRTDTYMCDVMRQAGTSDERVFAWLRKFITCFLAMERDMERTVKCLVEEGGGSAQESRILTEDEVNTADDRDVVMRDAAWYTDVTVNRQIPVRGYISHRMCGSGTEKFVKEVWVRPHVKQGYHRAAGVKK